MFNCRYDQKLYKKIWVWSKNSYVRLQPELTYADAVRLCHHTDKLEDPFPVVFSFCMVR